MLCFLELPYGVVWSLVVDWLMVQEVCRTDSAVCRRGLRKNYLGLVYNGRHCFKTDHLHHKAMFGRDQNSGTRLINSFIRWVSNKGALVNAMSFLPSHIIGESPVIMANFVRTIGPHLRHVLIAKYDSQLYQSIASELCKWCTNLVELTCPADMPFVLTQICSSSPNLSSIKLSNGIASDVSLAHMAEHCSSLTSLDVTLDVDAIPAWQSFLARRGLQLLSLSVSAGGRHDYWGLVMPLYVAIADYCQQLQTLCIRTGGIPMVDEVLESIVTKCTSLTSLQILDVNVSNRSMVNLMQIGTRLVSLHCYSCAGVADETFRQLADRCPNLQQLGFTRCPSLTAPALMHMAQSLPRLEDLRIPCSAVTNTSLQTIARCCPLLRVLDVSNSRITDAGLLSLIKQNSLLTALYLINCKGLTDASIVALAKRCPYLESLGFPATLGEVGLRAVAKECNRMRVLRVRNGMREKALQALTASGVYRPGCVCIEYF